MRRRIPSVGNEALAELMQRDIDAGIDPFDAPPPPSPLPEAPPAPLPPPFVPEPPDWREEERLAAEQRAREAAAAQQAELEPEQPSYPAAKRKSSATPRLDQVREWLR